MNSVDMPLRCDGLHPPALLRSEFELGKFSPVESRLVEFSAKRLAAALGIHKFVAVFSGYWPERGASMETCSFKELEALTVTARSAARADRTLVVASAGNTARAFMHVCSLYEINALIVVPESAMPMLWSMRMPYVRLVVRGGNADYADAIAVANRIALMPGFFPEGGVANVARRDGMTTVLLAAAEHLGRMPAYYFQAVSSGAGAITAWEASHRLRADEHYAGQRICLQLAQNLPFAPMADVWKRRSRDLDLGNERKAKKRIARIDARVLSNRTPPYVLTGGLYDAIDDTGGQMHGVTSQEARQAAALFESTEGCDIDPAAAALRRTVTDQLVDAEETVVINITGGGRARAARDPPSLPAVPDLYVEPFELPSIPERVARLVERRIA